MNRCSLYCRNEERRPEKCWDSEQLDEISGTHNPGAPIRRCPNRTTVSRKVPFTAEELAKPYPTRPAEIPSGTSDEHDTELEARDFEEA